MEHLFPMKNAVPERLTPGHGDWSLSGHQHLQRYALASTFAAGNRVLDWACGVGYGSHVLAHSGASHVMGADIAEDALAYARSHYESTNLAFVRADAQANAPEIGAFDIAVSFETIEHLPDPRRFIHHLADTLRPGGKLLISAPNALQHSRHPLRPIHNEFHLSEPTLPELLTWLAARFKPLRTWEQSPFSDPFAADAARSAFDHAQHGGYAWCRALNKIEDALRRLAGRPLPAPGPACTGWPARWAEILPLLPERASDAHTFIVLCQRT